MTTSQIHPQDELEDRTTLTALLPDPRNARSHSERNLELIAQSLTELGAARSIVVDETGTILAGNATSRLPSTPASPGYG